MNVYFENLTNPADVTEVKFKVSLGNSEPVSASVKFTDEENPKLICQHIYQGTAQSVNLGKLPDGSKVTIQCYFAADYSNLELARVTANSRPLYDGGATTITQAITVTTTVPKDFGKYASIIGKQQSPTDPFTALIFIAKDREANIWVGALENMAPDDDKSTWTTTSISKSVSLPAIDWSTIDLQTLIIQTVQDAMADATSDLYQLFSEKYVSC